MEDIISYLSKFREETPTWLENYLHGGQITFQDIMSSRVAFYPGYFQRGNCDGTLIKVGNKSQSVHSFLYVDYKIGRKELEEQIAKPDSFRGYHPIGRIEWRESDLLPSGQNHILMPLRHTDETPFCFSTIWERDEEQDNTWGAEHFIVTFLFAEGLEAYSRLFIKEYSKAPWLFLLNERYKGDVFGRDIQRSDDYPSFVIFQEKANKWARYEKVKDVHPVFGEFRCRRDLYKCMKYKFKVWIDGNYYYENEEYEREIDLSEEEYDTIKNLVKEYDGDLSLGLMPILETGSSELYQKFYRAIFPEVFLEMFSRDEMFEPEPGDENKSWDVDDFDYLMETYGCGYNFDDVYIVSIPDEIYETKKKHKRNKKDYEIQGIVIDKYGEETITINLSLYDDELERIKAIINSGDYIDLRDVVEEEFPELYETIDSQLRDAAYELYERDYMESIAESDGDESGDIELTGEEYSCPIPDEWK